MSDSNRSQRARAATLADVGRAAGVSAMAASAVLNGARTSSRIAPATRERILAAAARLRYRPNAAARALAARRMNSIGVATVYDDGTELNNYFVEILKGVLQAASHHEQNTTVFTFHNWSKDLDRLARLCDGRIDGMILVAPIISGVDANRLPKHTPFVTVHANRPLPGAINLESDDENGMWQLVTHLISLGHRRIAHFRGPRGQVGAHRRVQGYRRALAENKISFDPSLITTAGFTSSAGFEATKAWLARRAAKPLPDAISCANDACAIGCLEALSEAGIQVPVDISVTGFDDVLAARTAMPQLTTVRQPLRAMGEHAAEYLLQAIRQHDEVRQSEIGNAPTVFPTELVARASVADKRFLDVPSTANR